MKTRILLQFGVAVLAIISLGNVGFADEIVATGLDTVTTFDGSSSADYDLKVTLQDKQKIVVVDAASGPGDAQVTPMKGPAAGPGNAKIAFVMHQPGEAEYLVWGTFGGGQGGSGGETTYWLNQYTTNGSGNPRIVIQVNGPTSDDDYVGYGYGGANLTVMLLNGTPGATYNVTLDNAAGPGVIGFHSVPPLSTNHPIQVVVLDGIAVGFAQIATTVATTGPGAPATAPATTTAPVEPREWDKGDAMTGDYRPIVTDNILASSGEQVIFTIAYTDKDRWRINKGEWHPTDGAGPYEITITCTGDAEFNSVGSGDQKVIRPSLSAVNIPLFIKDTWDGSTNITVTAVVSDKAPYQAPDPDTGSAQDQSVTIKWTIIKRDDSKLPTIMITESANEKQWINIIPGPAIYTYKAGPDIGDDKKPDYANQTVLETFDTITADSPDGGKFFSMDDIRDDWKAANPGINTPDKVVSAVFQNGVFHATGTFVLDANDKMSDSHGGGFPDEKTLAAVFKGTAFYPPANTKPKIGYRLPQSYTAGPITNVLGKYTIDRHYFKKWAPDDPKFMEVRKEKVGPT